MAEAKGKSSMIFYHEWLRTYEELNDEEFGQLIRAVLKADEFGTETTFKDRGLRMAYKQIVSAAKANREKYEAACRRKSEYAKKREESKRLQRSADMCRERTDNEYDTDTDTEYDTESVVVSDTVIDVPLLGTVKDYFHNNNYKSDPNLFFQYNAARFWDRLKKGETWQHLAERWEANEKPVKKGGDPNDLEFGW